MKPLLSPKNDYVFKLLFTMDAAILVNLLNCLLGLSGDRQIRSVEIRNPEIRPKDIVRKFIILDIHAVDESGGEYDIEMQVRRYESYPRRTVYYVCKLYAEQLSSGEDYSELKPVFGIHFLDYELFPGHPEFHYRFRFRDERYPDVTLSDDLSIHIFELPKIETVISDTEVATLMEWLRFLNRANETGGKEMRQEFNNPMIHRAIDLLETLSADEVTRMRAEAREKALKDEAMFMGEAERRGRKEGWKEGRKEGKREEKLGIARTLLLLGDPISKIAQVTSLDMDELKKLEKELSSTTEH